MAADSQTPLIEVSDLSIRFGTTRVHEGLNLAVLEGEVLGIVGASGTGKSVLLHAIVGLLQPQSGSIHFSKGADNRKIGQQRWGVLFQNGALFSSLTVTQNIQIPMREHYRLSDRLLAELAELKLKMVGLPASAANKFPSELSGGMRKRAGLARALALDPHILFLDEPTAGLDPLGAAAFDDLIRELQKNLELTVFLVTHDLDTIYTICDRVAVLGERKVLTVGTLREVIGFQHPWVRDYFLGPRSREPK